MDIPSADELLNNTETPKILKRSWLRDGIEDVVLDLGGPKAFCQKIWDREPKEFIKLVGKLLPNQLEVPADTNLIVIDGNCMLIPRELTTPKQLPPRGPIEVEFNEIKEDAIDEAENG